MTYYTDEKYMKEKDGREYTVKLEVDEVGYQYMQDFLGEYKSEGDTWCVWRWDGTLRGDYLDLPEPEEPEPPRFVRGEPIDPDGLNKYHAAMEEYDAAYDEWSEAGPEILADYLPTMDRGEYEYFFPLAGGHESPGAKWTDQEGVEHEVTVEEWTKWAVRDYERASDFNRGGWCYVGVVVTTYAPVCACCGHVERLVGSLWGIESDSDDTYIESVIDDLISDLEHELEKYEPVKEV